MIALKCDVCGRIYQVGVSKGLVESLFQMCHLCKSLLYSDKDFSKEFLKRLKEIDRLVLSLFEDMREKDREFPPQIKFSPQIINFTEKDKDNG